MAELEKIDPELREAMDGSLKAYSEGDERFFEYFSEDARVFPLDVGEPIIGRKAFAEAYGPAFLKSKRQVVPTYQDLQDMGEQVILSQSLQVTVDSISMPIRQTVVWSKEGERWTMTHVHNGREGNPIVVGDMPVRAGDIRVLNERIATVAATLGVAQ